MRYRILFNFFALAAVVFGALAYGAAGDTQEQLRRASEPLRQFIGSVREKIGLLEPLGGIEGELADVTPSGAAEAVASVRVYKDLPLLEPENARGLAKPLGRLELRQNIGSGSGFFVTADGYMLTNRHVVADEEASYTVVLNQDTERRAEVVYRDYSTDLAVLKVEGDSYQALSLGDSKTLRYGQEVRIIGNAYGQVLDSHSSGTVSGLNRNVYVTGSDGSVERLAGLIQTSAALYPGDSGGPLLNSDDQAVGVNVASAIGNKVGFAIPINEAKEVLARAGVSL